MKRFIAWSILALFAFITILAFLHTGGYTLKGALQQIGLMSLAFALCLAVLWAYREVSNKKPRN